MESAINAVIAFLVLYFIYYYALRFIQSVFQSSLSCINGFLARLIYGISTPAHELAHLLVSIVCLARIENVKLFPTGNEPGYVKSIVLSSHLFVGIKEFFISIAPALINIPLFIFIECKYVLKCSLYDLDRILLPSTIFSKNGLITLGLFIVLISGIAPSHADLRGTVKGLVVFSVIIFVLTYFRGYIVVDIKSVKLESLISFVLYYFEVIVFTLLINAIIHFQSCFRIIGAIFKESIRHTFSKS